MTNVLLWRAMLITGEAARMWGQGHAEFSVPPIQLCSKLKTALEKFSLLKKITGASLVAWASLVAQW